MVIVAAILVAVLVPVLGNMNNSSKTNNLASGANRGSDSSPSAPSAASSSSSASPTVSAPTVSSTPTLPLPLTGTDGSVVHLTEDPTKTFVYRNAFGGSWTSVPFDDGARAQDDIPYLRDEWDYAKLRIRGVNLGGWLTLE